MENKKQTNIDIFSNLETIENIESSDIKDPLNMESNESDLIKNEEKNNDLEEIQSDKKSNISDYIHKLKSWIVFMIKYISTSAFIFMILLLATNYSAYSKIALSYLAPEKLEQDKNDLYASINSNKIEKEEIKITNLSKEEKKDFIIKKKEKLLAKKRKLKEKKDLKIVKNKTFHSMDKLINKTNKNEIKLDINLMPYENRVVIPKIAKNIPLVDINPKKVKWVEDVENIFMDELVNWIVRYPGSAKPWQDWNSFIFGHSSNFPWIKWNYNDVFALLDKVIYDDDVVVYYDQKKYTYKIKEKKVIKPWTTEILKRNKWKSEITLMTCWPVWTTLNRLVLIWELVETEDINWNIVSSKNKKLATYVK